MKKLVSLLAFLAISVSLFAQGTNYSKYSLNANDAESVKAAKTCMALLKQWYVIYVYDSKKNTLRAINCKSE